MRTGSMVMGGLVLALGLPNSAEGQFGKITKKAQDAVTQEAKPATRCTVSKFDDVVIELKEDVLTRVVGGIRARRRVTGRGGMTPQEMIRRSAKASDEHAALMEGRDADLLRYQDGTNSHGNCMSETLDRLREERSAALGQVIMSAGASDPQLIQDVQRLTMQQQERLAAGDTVGAQKAGQELMKLLGVDPKADTTKAKATCGRAPAKPAWLARADSLNDESNTLLWEARAADQRADTVGARAAGLGEYQFVMARERVEAYARSDGKSGCYSVAERTALDARMAELKELLD